jgi:TonB family protein
MRNLALMWVVAGCLLGCGGKTVKTHPQEISGGVQDRTSVLNSREWAVRRAVGYRDHTVQNAYYGRLSGKPDWTGRITVRFAIGRDGKVLFAEVKESTMGDEEFENIVVDIIKTWTFTKKDRLGRISEIVYTFKFGAKVVSRTYCPQVAPLPKEYFAKPSPAHHMYYNRGLMYVDKKDYDRAIVNFTEAIRLDSNYAKAYNNRGYTYAQKGEYDMAIADCNEAIRLNPNSAYAYDSRGFAYMGKKEYEKAIEDFETALRIYLNTEEEQENIAEAKKNLEEARKKLEETKKQNKTSGEE